MKKNLIGDRETGNGVEEEGCSFKQDGWGGEEVKEDQRLEGGER